MKKTPEKILERLIVLGNIGVMMICFYSLWHHFKSKAVNEDLASVNAVSDPVTYKVVDSNGSGEMVPEPGATKVTIVEKATFTVATSDHVASNQPPELISEEQVRAMQAMSRKRQQVSSLDVK